MNPAIKRALKTEGLKHVAAQVSINCLLHTLIHVEMHWYYMICTIHYSPAMTNVTLGGLNCGKEFDITKNCTASKSQAVDYSTLNRWL